MSLARQRVRRPDAAFHFHRGSPFAEVLQAESARYRPVEMKAIRNLGHLRKCG
jgi:hypothetical protein